MLHGPRMEDACAAARRRHANKHVLAIVAVANKTVTIVWRMLKSRTLYESRNQKLMDRAKKKRRLAAMKNK